MDMPTRRGWADDFDNVMLDPSLLVGERALGRVAGERGLRTEEIHVLVPSGFLALLEDQPSGAPLTAAWRFFLGGAFSASPSSILETLSALRASPFEIPPEADESLVRFRPQDAIRGRYLQDSYLVRVLQEEVAYLATQSVILARMRKVFDTLVKGGCIAWEGIDQHLVEPLASRIRRIGWRRVARKAAVGLSEVWAVGNLPHPWPQILGSAAVVFFLLDP